MTTRFSFRQREFARLYAQGLPAHKATQAAGYATSTAETNAARLLNHPRVEAYIERRRDNIRIISQSHLSTTSMRLYKMISSSEDDQVALKAIKEMRTLLALQLKYGAGLADEEDEHMEHIVDEEGFHQIVKTANDNKATQSLDNEDDEFYDDNGYIHSSTVGAQGGARENPPIPEEADTLPSGELAFDVRLTARKVETTEKKEPITIEFYPVPSPVYQDEPNLESDTPPNKSKRKARC